jgi:hypothetical protein
MSSSVTDCVHSHPIMDVHIDAASIWITLAIICTVLNTPVYGINRSQQEYLATRVL